MKVGAGKSHLCKTCDVMIIHKEQYGVLLEEVEMESFRRIFPSLVHISDIKVME